MTYLVDQIGSDEMQVVQIEQPIRVKVCEFDMSFWRLVLFLVKVAFAMLPALLILVVAQLFFAGVIAALMMR